MREENNVNVKKQQDGGYRERIKRMNNEFTGAHTDIKSASDVVN